MLVSVSIHITMHLLCKFIETDEEGQMVAICISSIRTSAFKGMVRHKVNKLYGPKRMGFDIT